MTILESAAYNRIALAFTETAAGEVYNGRIAAERSIPVIGEETDFSDLRVFTFEFLTGGNATYLVTVDPLAGDVVLTSGGSSPATAAVLTYTISSGIALVLTADAENFAGNAIRFYKASDAGCLPSQTASITVNTLLNGDSQIVFVPATTAGTKKKIGFTAVGTCTASNNLSVEVYLETVEGTVEVDETISIPILIDDTPTMWAAKIVERLQLLPAVYVYITSESLGTAATFTMKTLADPHAFTLHVTPGSTGVTEATASEVTAYLAPAPITTLTELRNLINANTTAAALVTATITGLGTTVIPSAEIDEILVGGKDAFTLTGGDGFDVAGDVFDATYIKAVAIEITPQAASQGIALDLAGTGMPGAVIGSATTFLADGTVVPAPNIYVHVFPDSQNNLPTAFTLAQSAHSSVSHEAASAVVKVCVVGVKTPA